MYKNAVKFYSFVIFVLIISACGGNCESEKTGEQLLGEPSKRFVPYTDGQQITLIGEDGTALEFTAEVERVTTNRNCVDYRCELTADPFGQTPCAYFETESIRNLLRSSDDRIYIDMIVSIFNYEEETELFYDRFSITASEVGTIGRAEEVTHVHFTDPIFNPNLSPTFNPFIKPGTVTLNGKTFADAYHSEVGDDMLFYQLGTGLIGLNIAGDTLVLN